VADAAGKETKKFLEWWSERQAFKGLYQSFLGANPGTTAAKTAAR